MKRRGNDPMLTGLSAEGLLKDLEIANWVGDPGKEYEYSNLGYALMGYVMERASGNSYSKLVRELVLVPYGMNQTYIEFPTTQQRNLATPYRKDRRNTETQSWVTGQLVAASGIYSTTRDLAKLMSAQIAVYREPVADDPLFLTNDARPVRDARSYGHGMNKDVFKVGEQSYDFYYHSGDMDGFAAVYMMVPEQDVGIVVLTSSGGNWKNQLGVLLLKKMMGLPTEMPEESVE